MQSFIIISSISSSSYICEGRALSTWSDGCCRNRRSILARFYSLAFICLKFTPNMSTFQFLSIHRCVWQKKPLIEAKTFKLRTVRPLTLKIVTRRSDIGTVTVATHRPSCTTKMNLSKLCVVFNSSATAASHCIMPGIAFKRLHIELDAESRFYAAIYSTRQLNLFWRRFNGKGKWRICDIQLFEFQYRTNPTTKTTLSFFECKMPTYIRRHED